MNDTSQTGRALAIILARGGSKRIPHKNVRAFGGRPMLGWPIEAARKSGLFSHIIVSTDSAEIAEAARNEGAEVPFLRPAELADDKTPARAVINHAILVMEEIAGQPFAQVCCLYGTAAFAQAADLQAAHAQMCQDTATPFVFAATTYAHPVQRAMIERTDGVEMIFPQYATTRSQDLEETLHDAGMFYWGRRAAFLEQRPMFGPGSRPYLLPRLRAQDIDTPEDWELAEALFGVFSLHGKGGDVP